MKNILVIDDDIELCALLVEYLGAEGFEVDTAHTGPEGAERALTGEHGLVVLDVMLPGMNGFEVLRHIRSASAIPVLMLTARGDDIDRIVGLEMGADDYLPKPFNPRELVARIKAVQRRTETLSPGGRPGEEGPADLRLGDLECRPASHVVLLRGEPVEVTAVEFSLLYELLRQAGRVLSREGLARAVLGRELALFDRSIDVHVSSLRKKLGPHPGGLERLKAVRGVGYLYVKPEGRNDR